MGATLEFDLTQADYGGLQGRCHEALVLNRPDVIEGVHASMLDAGAEVLETDTFQGSRLKLEEWGLGEHTLEINRKAAEIARRAAGPDRFVAGSIGPTGFLPASDDPTLGDISFRRLVEVFDEQAGALIEGGADLLIIETQQDILETKAAIFGAREAFKRVGRAVPIQASLFILRESRTMLLSIRCIPALTTTLTALDVDLLGLNCSTGPSDMRDAIRYLGESSPLPLHCIPNAGIPHQGPDGGRSFPRSPGRWRRRSASTSSATSPASSAAAAAHARTYKGGRREGSRSATDRPSLPRPDPGLLDDHGDAAGAGAAPHAGRRAGELAGLAEGRRLAARR